MMTRKQRRVALTVLGTALSLALWSVVAAQADDSGSGSDGEITMDDIAADQEKRDASQRALESVEPGSAPAVPPDEDSQLVQLGLPELGGIWLDETSGGTGVTIAIVRSPGLTIETAASRVQEALLTVPESAISAVPAALALRDAGTVVKAVGVKYSFAQLKEWQALVDPLFEQGAITMSDADERSNTVTLGVSNPDDIDRAIEFGVQAGVPRDAMKVVDASFQTSLRSDHRPVVGGQQIEYSKPRFGNYGTIFDAYNCSLGIPARVVNTSPQLPGYVTNSHCSIEYAEVDYVYHWQPSIPLCALWRTDNRIGYEVIDPPLFTGNPYGSTSLACNSGSKCRLSDVGFGRFDDGYTSTPRGYIARPSSTGTTTWNGSAKYRATATATPSGGVRAVGRTSGMSTGTITHSCIKVHVADHPGIMQVCQYVGTYSSDPGDSGGPVFKVTNSPSANDVTFVGLNWGEGQIDGQDIGVLSPWSNTLREFSPYDVRVCATGFSC